MASEQPLDTFRVSIKIQQENWESWERIRRVDKSLFVDCFLQTTTWLPFIGNQYNLLKNL